MFFNFNGNVLKYFLHLEAEQNGTKQDGTERNGTELFHLNKMFRICLAKSTLSLNSSFPILHFPVFFRAAFRWFETLITNLTLN